MIVHILQNMVRGNKLLYAKNLCLLFSPLMSNNIYRVYGFLIFDKVPFAETFTHSIIIIFTVNKP